MRFTPQHPPTEYTIHEWRRGKVSVVICTQITQFLVQVWVHHDDGRYPTPTSTDFCTQTLGDAFGVATRLIKELEKLPLDASHHTLGAATRLVAMKRYGGLFDGSRVIFGRDDHYRDPIDWSEDISDLEGLLTTGIRRHNFKMLL